MRDLQLRATSQEARERYMAEGFWTDDTFPVVVTDGLARHGGARARVVSELRPYEGTIGDLGDQGARLRAVLASRGIGAGDVVAFELPSWAEAAATFYGLLQHGVVIVPIVHIYGHKEVGHILRESGARALITADRFGSRDYMAGLESLRGTLPDLEVVIVVDASGPVPDLEPETLTWDQVLAHEPLTGPVAVGADDPALVVYTSGTTSAPKGAVHTHRTFLAELRQGARRASATDDAATSPDAAGSPAAAARLMPQDMLAATPVGHITGLFSLFGPILGGRNLHLLDVWDAGVALRVMQEDRLAAGGGPTFFLNSLLDHPDFDADVHVPLMARVGMGGAPIPAEFARRASSLGISIIRSYGCTEHPSVTMTSHDDPEQIRTFSDGAPMPGVEIRLIDDEGDEVPQGMPGEILSRGPELFVGYVDPVLTASAFDADGWYATGDIGVLDEHGNLTITDRKKDIIIRGGENVSAAEVEEALLRIPGILEAAVVAAPDVRYGEHGCAFVRLAPGVEQFDLDELRRHLDDSGLAKQKWPEECRFVDDFPRTASGKVQKHVLRGQLRDEAVGTRES